MAKFHVTFAEPAILQLRAQEQPCASDSEDENEDGPASVDAPGAVVDATLSGVDGSTTALDDSVSDTQLDLGTDCFDLCDDDIYDVPAQFQAAAVDAGGSSSQASNSDAVAAPD